MDMDIITANNNPRVKALAKLNKDAGLRRQRNVFVVEGARMFREIPADRLREVYLSKSAYERYGEEFDGLGLLDCPVAVLSDSVYSSVSQTKTPQGCMAVVDCCDWGLQDIEEASDGELFLVLDTIQDPGNMGTIIRSAEAAGVTAVIVGEDSCDPYNPKVVRSTMGAIFRVPLIICGLQQGRGPACVTAAISELQQRGTVVYGAHLDGENLYDVHFPEKTAFLIGNEGNGLSQEVSGMADRLLRIPMEGDVESLNAGVSATLLSYEVMRQRKYDRQN